MNQAWEISEDDVVQVLDAHDVEWDDELIEDVLEDKELFDRVLKGIQYYSDMEEQTESMLDDIENHLMKSGVISEDHEKQFTAPE